MMEVAVLAVGLLGTAWIVRLDGWQRLYVLTLALMVAATSNQPAVREAAFYPRYAAVAALVFWTVLTCRRTSMRELAAPARRLITLLWIIVGFAGVSIVWSTDRGLTAQQSVALALFAAFVQTTAQRRWQDRLLIQRDLNVAFVFMSVVFVLGLIAAAAGVPGARSFFGAAQGVFDNPNTLGMAAAIMVPIGLASVRRHPIYALGVAAAAASVWQSESRTALLAVVFGVGWMALRAGRGRLVWAYIAAWAITLAFMATDVVAAFSDLRGQFNSVEGGSRLNGRDSAWSAAWSFAKEHPEGYGHGTTEVVFTNRLGSDGFFFDRASVHNSYLQYLLELGFVALVPLVLLLAFLLRMLVRLSTSPPENGLAGAIAAGLLVHLAESAMFGTGQVYPYIYWLAVAAGAVLLGDREKAPALDSGDRQARLTDR